MRLSLFVFRAQHHTLDDPRHQGLDKHNADCRNSHSADRGSEPELHVNTIRSTMLLKLVFNCQTILTIVATRVRETVQRIPIYRLPL